MKKILKRILRILFYAIIALLFIYTIYYLVGKSRKETVVFETTSPFVTDIVKKTVATGSVVPRKEIEIKPKVSGIVDQLYVEAGDYVKEGDLIARIRIIPDMVSLNNAESRMNKAKISYENARIEYERQKLLFEKQVISEMTFLEYDVAFKNAKEELETAENNLNLIREGVTRRSGQATNTLIRSTIDGMILNVPIEEGNSVIESNTFNDGTTIASVANMNEMIFKGKIDESEVGKIMAGMDLILTVGAIEGEYFKAKLEYIAPKGVEENGAIQFEIKAAVQLKDSVFLRAGYSANADIVLSRKDSVMAIMESLLIFEDGKTYVEVEEGPQKFVKREIVTGLSDGINIEVVSGLTME
ncbi:MAG: efflux RND transporter periplasmic adaptor subunit, partial [Bacteroidota bacterium]